MGPSYWQRRFSLRAHRKAARKQIYLWETFSTIWLQEEKDPTEKKCYSIFTNYCKTIVRGDFDGIPTTHFW